MSLLGVASRVPGLHATASTRNASLAISRAISRISSRLSSVERRFTVRSQLPGARVEDDLRRTLGIGDASPPARRAAWSCVWFRT